MQRAIVFGATGGIGEAICQELAKDGWSLYLHYCHNEQKAIELMNQLSEQYQSQDFMPVKLDFLADNQSLEQWTSQLFPVNALVFAQGITDYGFLADQRLSKIDQIMQVNLLVPIKITRLLEQMLTKQEYSRIVYLGSVYGGQGSALEAVYSASKAGLSRFSQAYAREVASANLTVNTLAPGAVDTEMNKIFSEDTFDLLKEEIPMGRLAQGSDVAFWVKNLLAKESAYLTGQTIYVSGGWLL
ncbi:3-oxoacyl-(acyl-carrier protein) reductase [Lactobacillus pasteurii DSM 23907 = CRBIP 24.76]|uniref:3-oxoacyl-[acyl-carrier-protein] reductase n=1 Tax=Lactobacillus pasteurii DSM 23907 = CRBIP 24.76 TaxID=1423790 RepID=I7JZ04_9LACO|nr:SDR family NAD(P)-dependent oxidoreductase [Lactobacillus pasteurii]KRK08819.1 3-oxoacyl-(acyl-carrier protein) reductase [Lactobacillus pasteurii DSM 23907 = CRBIP 24.76]TDG76346.1 hypothetical protein C5L33_001105 [Lactobacillus pasteurii]CCI85930.1 3-oxoacyl-[acyl-carrier-protein] reductase [Lactobacillus pasteurii DSM 23907 = CRBIP 24.76]